MNAWNSMVLAYLAVLAAAIILLAVGVIVLWNSDEDCYSTGFTSSGQVVFTCGVRATPTPNRIGI